MCKCGEMRKESGLQSPGLRRRLHSLGRAREFQGKERMASVRAASQARVNASGSAEINRPGLIFTHWALLTLNDGLIREQQPKYDLCASLGHYNNN